MAVPNRCFAGIRLSHLNSDGELQGKEEGMLRLHPIDQTESLLLRFFKDSSLNTPAANAYLEVEVFKDSDVSRVATTAFVVNHQKGTLLIHFSSQKHRETFANLVSRYQKGEDHNLFSERTEESSASQYFQFYGYLSQQQNMMQDYWRTATYQRAVLSNVDDFRGKVILDVGAGSGILSFFAAQAGAARVYGIEASSMAKHAESLVYANRLQNVIKLIPGKIEEVELPEKVDLIISEPMGYMLYNERMLESYLHAKKFLKPGGKMFPTLGDLHIAPFSDAALFMEQINKANFWCQNSFHGIDLTCLRDAAIKEYFRQPVVDTFDMRILLAQSVVHSLNFEKADEMDLHKLEIPLEFLAAQSGELHGLAFWFDVAFVGTAQTVYLSTAPSQPLTHWYQVRCLVEKPMIVTKGQVLDGRCTLVANKRQSYDVDIEIWIRGTQVRVRNTLDLKNPFFRYSGHPVQAPPGFCETSPSQDYWTQTTADVHNAGTSAIPSTSVYPLGSQMVSGSGSTLGPLTGSQTQQHLVLPSVPPDQSSSLGGSSIAVHNGQLQNLAIDEPNRAHSTALSAHPQQIRALLSQQPFFMTQCTQAAQQGIQGLSLSASSAELISVNGQILQQPSHTMQAITSGGQMMQNGIGVHTVVPAAEKCRAQQLQAQGVPVPSSIGGGVTPSLLVGTSNVTVGHAVLLGEPGALAGGHPTTVFQSPAAHHYHASDNVAHTTVQLPSQSQLGHHQTIQQQ